MTGSTLSLTNIIFSVPHTIRATGPFMSFIAGRCDSMQSLSVNKFKFTANSVVVTNNYFGLVSGYIGVGVSVSLSDV